MKITKVASVEEAVSLAERLKAEGHYDWFRGQLRDWTPSSSLERKMLQSADTKLKLDAKLSRFLTWIENQPALAHLTREENIDSLFAVLQHYGFPTAYIDFSTEPAVAGFFASDTQYPPEDPGNSVIYCLNTAELKRFYKIPPCSEDGTALVAEAVTVDVPNLWRLQSQHGHFLFANHSWYRFFDMDKIVFPWTGTPAFPSREQIYPMHKSALEQLLDSYFFNERRVESEAKLRAMAGTQERKRLFRHFEIDVPDAYERDSFTSPLNVSEQWSERALKNWRYTPIELYHSTVGRQINISLRDGATAPSAEHQLRHAIKSAFNLQPELRTQAVEWTFSGLSDRVDQSLLRSAIRDAWNGMRNLPYTNDDIAAAFSALIILCAIQECCSFEGSAVDQAFRRWIPDAIHVEFGYAGSSYSRAYCSNKGLLEALEPAWTAKLKDPIAATSMKTAFVHTHDPRLMFDFAKLASLYAREIIPSQLAMKRPLVLFNPANLEIFGLP
jgi:hypothetical protein